MSSSPFIQKEQDEYQWLEWLPLIFVAASFAIAIYYFPLLPEKIPTHFNGKGEPDDWGSKKMVFLLPVITAALYATLMFVLKFIPIQYWNMPVKITPENAAFQYSLARNMIRVLNVLIAACFCYLNYNTIQVALKKASTLNNLFVVFFLGGIGLVVVGYMIKAMSRK